MEDDGFTLVTKRKSNKSKYTKTPSGKHIRADGNLEDIENAMQQANRNIRDSGICDWLLKRIQMPRKVFVMGNGHFDGIHEPGAHQLAMSIELASRSNAEIIFQDPVCTIFENKWLESKAIEIRTDLDAKIRCDESTLFVIIHGQHEILNEFFEFNFEHNLLNNATIIGNNYKSCNWELTQNKADFQFIDRFFNSAMITPIDCGFSTTSSSTSFKFEFASGVIVFVLGVSVVGNVEIGVEVVEG
ncbi:unnamed protein product [Caenorhabditis bovis]|uniref:SRR1-like domain-containing protein n=1 Tax=Caenorhabditis bovis TaxID=2654633 RepID=A0A8S1F180_9PELO|nr:unnamed protein product [Caenorhabditis bovis]